MDTPDACTCAAPGHCPVYGIVMPPTSHRLCQTRADYRATFARAAARRAAEAGPPPPPRNRPCLHLGAVVDQHGCGCLKRWTRACGVHGRCTTGDPAAGLACCLTCADYTPDDG